MNFLNMVRMVSSFIEEVIRLEKEYPNNEQFGSYVRALIRRYKKGE